MDLVHSLEHYLAEGLSTVARSTRLPAVPRDRAHRRDLFPLPDLAGVLGEDPPPCVRKQARLTLAGLNVLWGGGSVVPFATGRPTTAQAAVHHRVILSAVTWLTRMVKVDAPPHTPEEAWGSFESAVAAPILQLDADAVDLPATAGTCEPSDLLGSELSDGLKSPDAIAPREPIGHAVHRVPRHSMPEYVRLTVRELRMGKLVLLDFAKGIGTIFPVPKSGGRQRAVWHGTLVSEASARPVRPRRLGNPAAFLALDWPHGTTVGWSKRGAASFFDTLRCPPELSTWFGRPSVKIGDLRAGGLSMTDIRAHCGPGVGTSELHDDMVVYPCSRVWPMGYSWSSTVAQDVSLGLLRCSGFSEDQVVCVEEPPPESQREAAFVLTDDCIMAHADLDGSEGVSALEQRAAHRVGLLDKSMSSSGVQCKPEKDVTASESLTGMGRVLNGSPPAVLPDAASIRRCVLASWGLEGRIVAAPAAVASLLGTCQWFCLIARSAFAVFRHTYAFACRQPQDQPCQLPQAVGHELALLSALAPLITADSARDYIPLVLASDAAPEFGFGLATARASQEDLCGLGRLAERRGDYIRFAREGDPDAEQAKPRIGVPHRMTLRRCDFRHVLSLRAKRQEHSGVLEMNGALILFKWLARAPKHHGKRALVLLDAKVILVGIQKGRSSSRVLGRLLQRIAAHLLGCNILPRLLYVPSEDMPADAPSRGLRARLARRRLLKRPGFSKANRRWHRTMLRYERAADLLDEVYGPDLWDSSSSDTWSSGSSWSSAPRREGPW